MRFVLSFDMDNDAFAGDPGTEAADILDRLAKNVRDTYLDEGDGGNLLDVNGNTVGHWSVESN